ncbi:MAG: hypothetical protein IJR14_10840 [Synergistaceae bacterium]|nr:hypothetical protein [Synergistaceae bacterium]
MEIYLAGGTWHLRYLEAKTGALSHYEPYILESYWYARGKTLLDTFPHYENYFLDSGAFTLAYTRGKDKSDIDIDEYLERYADYVKRYRVARYLELDIDVLVGLEKVEELRYRLERMTGTQCIPVWHKGRGKEDFLRMCDGWPYVAIGGIPEEIGTTEFRYFPWFIDEAHRRGAKIHALGFTYSTLLPSYHFDSVDSSSWLSGGRYGVRHVFDGRKIVMHRNPDKQRYRLDTRRVTESNFMEWIKYQRWALTHL